MYDFIEHVIDPNLTIKTASEKIKPDGILVISTPDITSWHAKLMGKNGALLLPKSICIIFLQYQYDFCWKNMDLE